MPTLQIDLKKSVWVEEWTQLPHNYSELFKYKSIRTSILPGLVTIFSQYIIYEISEKDIFMMNGYPSLTNR